MDFLRNPPPPLCVYQGFYHYSFISISLWFLQHHLSKVVEPHLVKKKHITEAVSDHVSDPDDHIDTSVVSASHTSTSDHVELALRLIPSDVDSDSSNTSHPEQHPMGGALHEFSDHMDSETLSDAEDNQESVAGEVYHTRSGRPSKPPDRYTPSKALLVAVFGKD